MVTDPQDWGGWRVPGAEYDRDPRKIEAQARLIASVPKLMAVVRELVDLVGEAPDDAPPELQDMAQRCQPCCAMCWTPPPRRPGREDSEAASAA